MIIQRKPYDMSNEEVNLNLGNWKREIMQRKEQVVTIFGFLKR